MRVPDVEGVLSNPVALGMAHLRLLEAAAGGSALGQALGAGQVNQVDDAVRAHLRWLYVLVSVSLKPAVGKTDAVGLNPTALITYRSSEPPLVAVGLKSAVGLLQTRKQRVSNSVGYNVVAHRLGFRVPPRLHQRHGTEVEGVRVRLVACRTQRRCQLLARLALPGPRQRPPRLPHSDAKSANRDTSI